MGFVKNAIEWVGARTGSRQMWDKETSAIGLRRGHTPGTPAPPPIPDPNAAANAAQQQTDAMRVRRGLYANIYGGNATGTPSVGKQTLGT